MCFNDGAVSGAAGLEGQVVGSGEVGLSFLAGKLVEKVKGRVGTRCSFAWVDDASDEDGLEPNTNIDVLLRVVFFEEVVEAGDIAPL